jgi:hypothetical protein
MIMCFRAAKHANFYLSQSVANQIPTPAITEIPLGCKAGSQHEKITFRPGLAGSMDRAVVFE